MHVWFRHLNIGSIPNNNSCVYHAAAMGSIPKHNIYVFQLLIKLSLKKDENKQKEAIYLTIPNNCNIKQRLLQLYKHDKYSTNLTIND